MGDSVVGGSKVLTSEPILLRASDIFFNFLLLRGHKISNSVVLNKSESHLYQYQSIKVSKYQSITVSKYQSIKVSKYLSI